MTGKVIKIPSEKFIILDTETQKEMLLQSINKALNVNVKESNTAEIRNSGIKNGVHFSQLIEDIIFYMGLMQKQEINIRKGDEKEIRGLPMFCYNAKGRLNEIIAVSNLESFQLLMSLIYCLKDRFMPSEEQAAKLKLI